MKWIIDKAFPVLIVGLGNPGASYEKNRHNIGFRAVELFRQAKGLPQWSVKFRGLISHGNFNAQKIICLQPQTYMNLSGDSVQQVCQFYKIPLTNILVVHDDIDLNPGKVKLKQGGGHGGHNGLRSLDQHLGKNYWRLRVGVGHPGHRNQVSGYVLQNFSKEEEQSWVFELLAHTPDALSKLLSQSENIMAQLNKCLSDAISKKS